MDKNILLSLVLLIFPLVGMEPSKSAKRKLFERDTPLSPAVSPTKGYTTAPDTPATPYKAYVEKLAARNILPIAVFNTSNMPAMVTYETAKGQAHRMLPSSLKDFKKSRLDAEVSFREPITIAPNEGRFHRILLNRENNKLEIQEYRPAAQSEFETIGDIPLNLANPIIIQLVDKQDARGGKFFGIHIKND